MEVYKSMAANGIALDAGQKRIVVELLTIYGREETPGPRQSNVDCFTIYAVQRAVKIARTGNPKFDVPIPAILKAVPPEEV